eukprot:747601-Hanusia_phi.AAC.1
MSTGEGPDWGWGKGWEWTGGVGYELHVAGPRKKTMSCFRRMEVRGGGPLGEGVGGGGVGSIEWG